MKTAYRIKERRKQLGLTATQFAKKLGVHHSTVYRYENGDIEKVPTDILSDIAKILDTTPAFLMGWEDATSNAPITTENKITMLDRNLKDPQHSQWIAYGEELLAKQTAELGQNVVEEKIVSLDDYRKRVDKSAPGKVSAGTGFWQEDDYDTMVSFYEDEIPDDDDYDTIAIVVGHSMEPKIKNGDFLFIKLTNSIDVNKIGIFQVNGENYVKKLKQGYLESLNKEYNNIELSEHDDIRTIGEVVSVYREN